MMSIIDKEELSEEQKQNKAEVIQILETLLRQPNSKELSFPTSDQELDGISWLGWTVVNGTAHDVKDLINSKLPPDPLMGKSERKQYKLKYKIRYQYSKSTDLSRSVLAKVPSRVQDILSLKIIRQFYHLKYNVVYGSC